MKDSLQYFVLTLIICGLSIFINNVFEEFFGYNLVIGVIVTVSIAVGIYSIYKLAIRIDKKKGNITN